MSDEARESPKKQSASLTETELRHFRKEAKRGFLWIFSTTIVWQMCSWLCTLVTVRILRPEDYGVVALPDAVFPYLVMLATLKLDTWLMQVSRLSDDEESSVMSLLLILASISTAGGLIAAPFLAQFYEYPELERVAQVMCLMFLPRAVRLIPEVRLRKELNFKPMAISNLVIGLSRGLLQILMAWVGWGFWSLIWGAIFFEIALLLWLAAAAGLPRRLSWNTPIVKDGLLFGASATGSTIFWVIFSTADNLVVGKLFGAEALGFYSTAFLLTDMPLSKINSVLSPVILPYYSKLKHNPDDLYRGFIKLNRFLVAVIAPVLVGLGVVADTAVPLLFGENWKPMIQPLQVMCVVGILRSLTANISSVLYAVGKPQAVLRCSAAAALVLPPAFVLFGYLYGMPGIYGSWLLIYPFVGPLLFFRAVSTVSGIPIVTFLMNFWAPLVSVILLAFATLTVKPLLNGLSPWLALLIEVLVGAAAYVGSYMLLFKTEYREALQQLRQIRT